MGGTLAIFCGPSLPSEARVAISGATYLPPAARGEVERAARDYDAVLLIDGLFHHDLAPSPKECFAALSHARMFGASSMGALRGVECAPYGFATFGAIARWYAAEIIDGDDEVALLTHPQTHAAMTVPLVNVRYVAWLAVRRALLSADEARAFVAESRAIYYMERSWEACIAHAPALSRTALLDIARNEGDLKRHDARFALRSVQRALARPWRRDDLPAPTARFAASLARRDTSPIVLPATMPKAPGTYDRAVPFAQTLALLPELRRRYGITRVADTTLLDRTSIPTHSAFVPHSPDLLGVYNGKGITREGAIASAVMEAGERQIGARAALVLRRELLRSVAERIDLDECGLRPEARDLVVECVRGTELLSGDVIPVPLAMVECPWFGEKLFTTTSTNGLASGNNLTEAIYHALCELIERHAWALAHVRCSLAPKFFLGPDAPERALMPEIELPVGESNVDWLVRELRDAGLTVHAFALDEPPLPMTVLASISEPDAAIPMAHMGLGCALSPAHALTRALTEALQSRVVDIQAAREDMLRADEPKGIMGDHARRLLEVPKGRWYLDIPAERVALADLSDRSSEDLAADLRVTLDALRAYGIPGVVAVDLSPSDLPISVVRAIVPGLEHAMITQVLGKRARALLNPFAVA
uniref:YcaO domain-containing protein n=1 Tax=mine drainage metagenome TaxID=410659 RepID=E6Q6B2_9ZZZZ